MKKRLMSRVVGILAPMAVTSVTAAGQAPPVPRYGIFEAALEHAGDYANPYWDIEATAELTGPEGKTVTVDLFWDGEKTWRFRYSPPTAGTWKWKTASRDPGLDGKSGEFACVPSDLHGGIRPMKDYPFHFQYEDGTPFWLFGDTAWSLYGSSPNLNWTRETFERYVKVRAGQKFNFIEGILSSPGGNEGGRLFADREKRRLNPPFCREVDGRLAFLNRHGVTAMMFLSWGNPTNMFDWKGFPDREGRLRYARYAMGRFGAFNICFGVCGEWDWLKDLRADFEEIGRTLHAHNPHGRMIAIHPGSPRSTREFADQDWMSFGDYQQNYRDLHEMILSSRYQDHSSRTPWPPARRKPVVNGEYALFLRDHDNSGRVSKANSATIEQIRHATYDIAMAGGYFVTGWGSTYWGGFRNPRAGFTLDHAPDKPWEEQAPHIYDLFTSLEWWKLGPSDHLVRVPGAAPPKGKRSAAVAWCLAEPGRQYLVYVRGARQVTAALDEAGGPYRLTRFDPRTGERADLGDVAGGQRKVDTPDAADHVFIISAAPAKRRTPMAFPLSEQQAMGPRFLDTLREALQRWSMGRFDPKTGAFGSLADTSDVVWIRYACHAADLDEPQRAKTLAYLDAEVPALRGHQLWMAVRAMRILGGQPSRAPACYGGLTAPDAFAAFAREHIVAKRGHHHEVLGMLPLVVSSGEPAFPDALLEAIGGSQLADGTFGDYSRTFAYTAIHLAVGREPPRPDKLADRYAVREGQKAVAFGFGAGYREMDDLYMMVRFLPAVKHPAAERTREALRAGLPQTRSAFVRAQEKLWGHPHQLLAAVHILGLLQEAAADELPSERPYRFDWDNLDLYKCKWPDDKGAAAETPRKESAMPRHWPTPIPEDCPFERSRDLHAVAFTGRYKSYGVADYFTTSWATDGNLYATCGDGRGIWNAGLYKIAGDDPLDLQFTLLGNFNIKKGQAEKRRYGSCILIKDGVCFYGFEDGWNTSSDTGVGRFWGFAYARQYDRARGDMTELLDGRWHLRADSGWTDPNRFQGRQGLKADPSFRPGGFFDEPEGTNRIRCPRFVDFGMEMRHATDGFAYMTAHGSEGPKPPEWANGDSVFLMRAKPTIEGITRPEGWEFFAGHDAAQRPLWARKSAEAKPLLTWTDRLGSASVTYLPARRKYIMCMAPLVVKDHDSDEGGPKLYSAQGHLLLEADRLTGPWRVFQFLGNFGPNAYVMSMPSKFVSKDERSAWLLYSAGWGAKGLPPNPPGSAYAACFLEVLMEGH